MVSRRNEVIKNKLENNIIENRKTVKKISKTKICLFEKIKSIN